MPTLTIKNIPSDLLYSDLQRTTAQHRKTISSHIIDCLKAVMHQGAVAEQKLKRGFNGFVRKSPLALLQRRRLIWQLMKAGHDCCGYQYHYLSSFAVFLLG
jgi:hypothetical protein